MNWDTIKGDWKQFSGKVKEKWGKLTDDDLAKINGQREQLEGNSRSATVTPRIRPRRRSIIGRNDRAL